MNKKLLNTGVQQFINKNLNADIMSVLLKNSPFEGVRVQELAQQITAKKKSKLKLPCWYNAQGIYYPKPLSIEQSSSDISASYKAEIIRGKSLVDTTGGFGVDSFYFSKKFKTVYHCEIDPELSQIASHNFGVLKAKNIEALTVDGIEFVINTTQSFDVLYADPSRRDDNNGRVFKLSDCQPNIPKWLDKLFNKVDTVLIKTSPLLDISSGIKELQFVKEIHVLAIDNDVKELLWKLEKGSTDAVVIRTINFTKRNRESFSFNRYSEKSASSSIAYPRKYLYEPNAAIMKSGGFKSVGNQFLLNKLHEHTHLYTSAELKEFPGRRFEVIRTIPYNKKALKSLGLNKANISTRNFPETVATIRKWSKIKEGGDCYLFFITDKDGNYCVLQCAKV